MQGKGLLKINFFTYSGPNIDFENPLKGGKPNDRIYFWHGPASNYRGMLPQSERPLIRVSFQSPYDCLKIMT